MGSRATLLVRQVRSDKRLAQSVTTIRLRPTDELCCSCLSHIIARYDLIQTSGPLNLNGSVIENNFYLLRESLTPGRGSYTFTSVGYRT